MKKKQDDATEADEKAAPEPMAAQAQAAGLDLEQVKAGLRRLLPVIRPIAKLTPNKVDDAAVAFLESLVAE